MGGGGKSGQRLKHRTGQPRNRSRFSKHCKLCYTLFGQLDKCNICHPVMPTVLANKYCCYCLKVHVEMIHPVPCNYCKEPLNFIAHTSYGACLACDRKETENAIRACAKSADNYLSRVAPDTLEAIINFVAESKQIRHVFVNH